MWGSKFLAFLIAEEASTSPSSFLASLEAAVRSFKDFNVVIARCLVNQRLRPEVNQSSHHGARECVSKMVFLPQGPAL